MQTKTIRLLANQAWVLVMRRGHSIEEAAAELDIPANRLERLIMAFGKRRAAQFNRHQRQ
jgi:hypothetical protein